MSDKSEVEYHCEDGAAWITLNRPEKRNALSQSMLAAVFERLKQAQADDTARCIVLTGVGRAFCSGADLTSQPDKLMNDDKTVSFVDLYREIIASNKPVIAAVNGAAFAGGLGLIAAADIVLTSDDALFSFSEVTIGVIPAIISVMFLKKLGTHQCNRLFLTGRRFDGKQAVDMGLAHQSVPATELMKTVKLEIDMLNKAGPIALGECKKLIRDVPGFADHEAFELAETWSAELFASAEAQEGMQAFREKRPPSWRESRL